MGRHAERPETDTTTELEGNLVELRFDDDGLDIVVTRPPAPPQDEDADGDGVTR